ncbi:transcriptional regulator SutA [Pseudomonas matsuisoli]|uniref:Transcriptional regulator SutA RNAP-binding domain-containing protein n=1 Tax=Pseudomonas matsuisoli TaxID=1515666 RepID=A0A917V064_9PSED|nr:transcriptional regulator SutA [Pseudomonas matsuisoli]GGK03717.1 hypothetical protein GCM10009304_32070 [Pseudomonas matsuisoli]
MSEEELEQDDLESEEEDDEGLAADAADDSDDDSEQTPAKNGKKAKAAAEPEELPSVEAKQRERDALSKAMEEFLSRGGRVQEIEDNVVADPPKKPEGKYGSRPI